MRKKLFIICMLSAFATFAQSGHGSMKVPDDEAPEGLEQIRFMYDDSAKQLLHLRLRMYASECEGLFIFVRGDDVLKHRVDFMNKMWVMEVGDSINIARHLPFIDRRDLYLSLESVEGSMITFLLSCKKEVYRHLSVDFITSYHGYSEELMKRH